ncbi:DUF2294 domain-containing protein [Alkalihalobacillus sp. MEB130]|uniref:Na-translocating system protein MpsC family protein n=1 Tax=Alkalihalobacillus sp. MEB130 TaxID=2976704 RepID=UPI0028DF228A|nr:Na-translocating system protein MpsC family protein [Alkalihalobacillus sp. MEB130]MDT8860892.1 DUF2294 domain-containing protein [Alkalihalobacillus sp. MEB130]
MLKESSQQQELTYLSSYISKVMKRNFGKGPELCTVFLENNLILVKFQNFITPAEEVLYKKNELQLALQFRAALISAIIEEVKPEIETLTNLQLTKPLYDWNYEKNVGVIMFETTNVTDKYFPTNTSCDISLIEKVKKVSGKVHKSPANVALLTKKSNVFILECYDVLIKVESLLFENKYDHLLLERAQEIRKNFELYHQEFELVLDQKISELFITWDYENNKSYIMIFGK